MPETGDPRRGRPSYFADGSLRGSYVDVPRQRFREVLRGQVQGGGRAAAAPEVVSLHVVVSFPPSFKVLF